MIEITLKIENKNTRTYLEFFLSGEYWPHISVSSQTPSADNKTYTTIINSIEAEEIIEFLTIFVDKVKKEQEEDEEFQRNKDDFIARLKNKD